MSIFVVRQDDRVLAYSTNEEDAAILMMIQGVEYVQREQGYPFFVCKDEGDVPITDEVLLVNLIRNESTRIRKTKHELLVINTEMVREHWRDLSKLKPFW